MVNGIYIQFFLYFEFLFQTEFYVLVNFRIH